MRWLPRRITGWELLPTFVTCAGPFARTKGGTELCCILVSLSVQPLHSYSGSGSRAASAPLCWKCRVRSCILVSGWVVGFFFHPGKIPLTLLSCINLGGLSLLSLLGAGGMWGKQAEGRGILSCLRHLLRGGRGCRAEPRSLPQSDLIIFFFKSYYHGVLWL